MAEGTSTLFDTLPQAHKVCPQCKQRKLLQEFYPSRKAKRGVSSWCRDCSNTRTKARHDRYRAMNRNRVAAEDYLKWCRTCKQTKRAAEFYKNVRIKDALAVECRVCSQARFKKMYAESRAIPALLAPKKCPVCKETKPASGFGISPLMRDGIKTVCKRCEHLMRVERGSTIKSYLRRTIRGAEKRKHASIPNLGGITLDHLLRVWKQQKGRCIYTGIKMAHRIASRGTREFWRSVSLDRIDSSKPYESNNVQLVCRFANLAKADMNEGIFAEFLEAIWRHQRKLRAARHDATIDHSPSLVPDAQVKSSESR
jgi:hypothetical protein